MIDRDGSLVSLWQVRTGIPGDSYSSDRMLPNEKTYDVVVVGGGITGISTALLLQEAGYRCAVVEGHTLCFGATGGTTAHLNTVLDTPYTTIAKNFGKEGANLVAEAAAEAIDLVRRNCEKYAIDAEFEWQKAYIFSRTPEQTQLLEEMKISGAEAGVSMEYVDTLPAPMDMQKAVVVDGQAKFHPTRYVLGMARAFQQLGGRIFEHCRVLDTDEDQMVTVHMTQGDLQCKYLIYATHLPPGINLLDTRCAPYRSYAIAARLNGGYPDGLIYDLEQPFHYYRTQIIDGEPYFIAGGEDHKTGHAENTEACFIKLESHVRRFFDIGEVNHRWSAQYYEPADGLPYIGHMPGKPGHRLVATGFSGNGMVYSGVAALLFKNLLLGSPDRYVKLFDPNRVKPMAGTGNFIRENLDVARKWVGKLLPAHKLQALAELAPGEGRVVRFEGETIALYKTETGQLKALSPTCPHMGCHVVWNSAEKTWDCPCHGARYAIDGTVITGPAQHDLERISVRELIVK